MRNIVTVSQQFPTWAAAYEARERLAREDGFDRHGIDRIEIERFAGKFELLVRTDERHRDEIAHILQAEEVVAPPPTRARVRRGSAVPLLLLGTAALAGVAVYTLLGTRRGQARTAGQAEPGSSERRARAPVSGNAPTEQPASTPMFTLQAGGVALAVTKGNESEARAIFEGTEFKDKLRRMESDGTPLWNGSDGLTIRPASRSEIRAFVQYAETLGFEDEEEGDIILYLQPIDSADEFDETQDG
jgi:hypothetical protein